MGACERSKAKAMPKSTQIQKKKSRKKGKSWASILVGLAKFFKNCFVAARELDDTVVTGTSAYVFMRSLTNYEICKLRHASMALLYLSKPLQGTCN